MLRKLRNRIKGQSTAEYAVVIGVIVAATVAMSQFIGRAAKGRTFDAAKYLVTQTRDLGSTLQYEPYYLTSNFEVTREQEMNTFLTGGNADKSAGMAGTQRIKRASGGSQEYSYNVAGTVGAGMTGP